MAIALSWTVQAQFHFKSKKQPVDTSAAATGFGVAPGKSPVKKKKHNQLLPLKSFYVLTGRVKDSSNVFLWLSIKDSVVKGQAIYALSQDTFRVFGTVEPDSKLVICGFSPDGNMRGAFIGKILDDSVFQGRWMALTSDSAWNCTLYSKDTVPAGIDTNMVADHVEGTYSYHLGDLGAAGGIIIHKVNQSSLSMDIGCAGPPPDLASAMIKIQEIPFDGQSSVYQSPGKPGCKLRVRVFKDFVVINFVNKQNQCGYGASVEGVFARIR